MRILHLYLIYLIIRNFIKLINQIIHNNHKSKEIQLANKKLFKLQKNYFKSLEI
jgi:hypothetical protein